MLHGVLQDGDQVLLCRGLCSSHPWLSVALSTPWPYNTSMIKNDSMTVEELKDLYCDCYKDVHGIKARWVYGMDLTVAELEGMMARLEQEWVEVKAAEDRREAQAELEARKQIQALIEHGAKDVTMAVRWMHDAEGTDGDNRFLDYTLGTRYGFIDDILKNGL